jgi:hypothetical protein
VSPIGVGVSVTRATEAGQQPVKLREVLLSQPAPPAPGDDLTESRMDSLRRSCRSKRGGSGLEQVAIQVQRGVRFHTINLRVIR